MWKGFVVTLVVAAAVSGPPAIAASQPKEYVIAHLSTSDVEPLPSIYVRHGQKLTFVISDTFSQCYLYNLTEKRDTPEVADIGLQRDEVRLSTDHDAEVTAYEVAITLRQNAATECPNEPRKYTIPIRPFWNLAYAGGFTRDELDDPQFFLESGTKDGKTGFFVREDGEAGNRYNIGGSAMVHLYHNTGSPVEWAPLTFGLSLEDSEPRYLLGTTARFGSLVYLTVGMAFGERDRLPTGVRLGDFTENANLIATPGKRRDQAVFASLSFKFLEQGLQPFKNVLKKRPVLEQPTTPTPAPAPNPAQGAPSITTTDHKERKVDEILVIKGLRFGATPTDKSIVKFGTVEVKGNTAAVTSWKDTEISVKVPADVFKGLDASVKEKAVKVVVVVNDKPSEEKDLKVTRP